MSIIYALVTLLMTTGEVRTTVYQLNDMPSCVGMVQAFRLTEKPENVRDARITCLAVQVNPYRDAKPT